MGSGARLTVVLLLLGGCALAAEVDGASAVNPIAPEVAALAAVHARHTAIHGTFRWLTQADPTATPRERLGTFDLQRGTATQPTRYSVRTSAPDETEIIRWWTDGHGRWQAEQAVSDDAATVRSLRSGGSDIDLDQVVACVLLDLPTLARDFALAVVTRDGAKRLEFTPTSPAMREQVAGLAVILAGDQPQEVILDDVHGGRVRLVLTALQFDQAPDERLFAPPLAP
jgi:hypothetical protein